MQFAMQFAQLVQQPPSECLLTGAPRQFAHLSGELHTLAPAKGRSEFGVTVDDCVSSRAGTRSAARLLSLTEPKQAPLRPAFRALGDSDRSGGHYRGSRKAGPGAANRGRAFACGSQAPAL